MNSIAFAGDGSVLSDRRINCSHSKMDNFVWHSGMDFVACGPSTGQCYQLFDGLGLLLWLFALGLGMLEVLLLSSLSPGYIGVDHGETIDGFLGSQPGSLPAMLAFQTSRCTH